jgi:predicted enzyme related to lactoylglutathione lyase
MSQFPEPFGVSFTVAEMDNVRHFYESICSHDEIKEGVFAGIAYVTIMRGGECQITLFQAGEGNPLAATIPTLKVDSVTTYVERTKQLGGNVLVSACPCPATGAQFAICVDAFGNQFMVKETRAT